MNFSVDGRWCRRNELSGKAKQAAAASSESSELVTYVPPPQDLTWRAQPVLACLSHPPGALQSVARLVNGNGLGSRATSQLQNLALTSGRPHRPTQQTFGPTVYGVKRMLSRRAAMGCVLTTVLLGLTQPALAARGVSFQAIDSNSDGKVDLDEVKKAASAKFESLDRNRTGTLTRREVGRLRLSRKDFTAADPDKDGTLSKDEYLAIVEQQFKAADTKQQGTLTLSEFNSRAALPLRRLIY
jgi:hypothetical protein